MTRTPFVWIGSRWHRVKVLRAASPYITTKCGLDRDSTGEYYWDPAGSLPLGLTCRRCVPA